MRIAQISDLHVLDLETVHPRDFFNKRITGALNLVTGRRNAHPIELCERLVEDLTLQKLDHVVVTGDVTNLSLPGEFQRVARLLRTLGGYDNLTVIPGNHDVYTDGAQEQKRFESYFGHLLFGADSTADDWVFPAVKELPFDESKGETPVVVIGLCSALKTPFLTAWGRVGEDQLSRLDDALDSIDLEGRFVVALVHHNLHTRRSKWAESTANLRDRDEVITRLHARGVNLLLHGHTHKANRFAVTRGEHSMLVVGCGSSTQNTPDPARVARYNIYTVDKGLKNIRTRVWDPRRRRFAWLV
jgi:3',5'-cyclic AMP phosphodiesterase CpdA